MNTYISFVKKSFKENIYYIITAFVLLLIFILFFVFVPIPEEKKAFFIEQARQLVVSNYSTNSLILFRNIFINNITIGFLILISGFFMSLFAILLLSGNVMIIFIIASLSIEKIGVLKTILGILPHGILEISAVLLSVALAFKITVLMFKKVWNWKQNKLVPHLKEIFKFWFALVLPLFFIAAFIETFVTPLFL